MPRRRPPSLDGSERLCRCTLVSRIHRDQSFTAQVANLCRAQVYPVGSVNGEALWAETTHRRLVLDVDLARPVAWQLLPGIIGASATVPIPSPQLLTITPDGTMAFLSSPQKGLVTPIRLGLPGTPTTPGPVATT